MSYWSFYKLYILIFTCLFSIVSAERRTFAVMIPMRDGVELHTRIVLPKDTPAIAVMDRSPYGATNLELLADIYVPFGFASIGQDMRGTGKSEGNFTIWHSDANDAYDTMQWIAQQDWSNGEVYTIGASADGLASFVMALAEPEWLHAQFIIWASSVAYRVIYQGYTYHQVLADDWLLSTVPVNPEEKIVTIKTHEYPDDWWIPLDLSHRYDLVKWPSVMWAGWYDIFLVGNLMGYEGFQHESDPTVQGKHRLVVDPLGHCQSAESFFPDHLIEGRTAIALLMSFELYGINTMHRDFLNVTFYVMGSNDTSSYGNFWTTLNDFPTFTFLPMYLHGDGTVSRFSPSSDESSTSSYVYDPTNPVPTIGGNNLQIACGPLDQSSLETRDDVIVFTSAELTEPLAVTGPLMANLYVSSNATDTDFMVKLTDVYPTGESRLIQDTAFRMRWKDGPTPFSMEPDNVYHITLSLWNTSYIFSPGHKIRVAITSSNYPRFSVNPNNGYLLVNETGPNITALNTIHHSDEYPSHISLPVVAIHELPPYDFIENSPSEDFDLKTLTKKFETYLSQKLPTNF